jgi:hypothetical protein
MYPESNIFERLIIERVQRYIKYPKYTFQIWSSPEKRRKIVLENNSTRNITPIRVLITIL